MGLVASTASNCCINLQVALDNLVPNNVNPGRIMKEKGFLGSLLSERNTRGFDQEIVSSAFRGKGRPTAGQAPKVEVKYLKPRCNTSATTVGGLCTVGAATPDPYGYLQPEVTLVRSQSGSFSKADFERICETPQERLAIDLQLAAEDLNNDMNSALIALAAGQLGNYSNGTDSSTTPYTINILNPAGYANAAAFSSVSSEFRKMHTREKPIMVGGDILSQYLEVRASGGLGANAIGAVEGAGTSGYDIYADFEVDVQMQTLLADTDSHMIAYLPGSMQLLQWYRNVGEFEELGKEDYAETTLEINGITYDYTLNYDKCTKTWNWELFKHFDLWCIPDAAYAPCYDFNGKLGFKLGCGNFDCTQYMP